MSSREQRRARRRLSRRGERDLDPMLTGPGGEPLSGRALDRLRTGTGSSRSRPRRRSLSSALADQRPEFKGRRRVAGTRYAGGEVSPRAAVRRNQRQNVVPTRVKKAAPGPMAPGGYGRRSESRRKRDTEVRRRRASRHPLVSNRRQRRAARSRRR